ncbi:integrase core domain-containing protein [Thermodesulfobacteriota bacterium]
MIKKQFDQKQKLAILESAKEIGIKDAAKIADVHYTTVYDWKRQLDAYGKEAFLSHKPKSLGRGIKQISEKQEAAIIGAWKANPGYGPGQVRSQLRRQGTTISIRTIRNVMEANGYKPYRKKEKNSELQRFEAERPLALAQMDILELFINKLKLYLILLIDDFSRFILGFRLLEKTSIDDVIDLVGASISRFGKMEELLTDRGFVFYSWRGINRFERYLEAQRIEHTHARPHHPQTLGKVEALNRRIQNELFAKQQFSTANQATVAVQGWVEHYNYHRPHQGLGGLLTPAERFHGKAEKVLDDIAKGCDVTGQKDCIERSIFNLVLADDGRITFYLLGQPLVVAQGSRHV